MEIPEKIKAAYLKWSEALGKVPEEEYEPNYKKLNASEKRYYKAFIKECEKENLYHIEIAAELFGSIIIKAK